jgi:RimJ/RimL family protein N-acetyltransferase
VRPGAVTIARRAWKDAGIAGVLPRMRHLTSDDNTSTLHGRGRSVSRVVETTERVVLPAGRQVLIRPLDCRDRERLSGLFARMSRLSRQRRFFSPKHHLSERELTYFTDIDHARHEALAAVDARDGSFVGVARYVQYRERPRVADVAVEVADEQQALGVATMLVERLVERGRANGLDYLSAVTRWENAPARALARRVGFHACSSRGGEITLAMSLEPRRPELQRPELQAT